MESDRDSPAEFSEPIKSGHDHKIRVRISLTGDDVVLIVNTADTILAAKRKLQSQETGKVPEPKSDNRETGPVQCSVMQLL